MAIEGGTTKTESDAEAILNRLRRLGERSQEVVCLAEKIRCGPEPPSDDARTTSSLFVDEVTGCISDIEANLIRAIDVLGGFIK